MRIPNLFSKRNRKPTKKLVIDQLPQKFRRQVGHVLRRSLGDREELWKLVHDAIAEAHGYTTLDGLAATLGDWRLAVLKFLDDIENPTDEVLDLIELAFRMIEGYVASLQDYQRSNAGITSTATDAVTDLNAYFAENGLGYRYADGQVVRVDSELLHVEVTEKALTLLHIAGFSGPESEFLSAHRHYRHRRYKEAVTDALKAFESTMKSIAAARRWSHKPGAAAKDLIALMFQKQLIPAFMETQFAGLRQLLESGAPTIRNKMSGHGQGPVPVEMPPHLAALALHIAAANIVFLTEAHATLK